MSCKTRILVKGGIPGYAAGSEIEVDADEEGTPLDLHWRRRLKDAEIDGCCEVVVERETTDIPESEDSFDEESLDE
jgi:hypothetical protein